MWNNKIYVDCTYTWKKRRYKKIIRGWSKILEFWICPGQFCLMPVIASLFVNLSINTYPMPMVNLWNSGHSRLTMCKLKIYTANIHKRKWDMQFGNANGSKWSIHTLGLQPRCLIFFLQSKCIGTSTWRKLSFGSFRHERNWIYS